MVSLKCLALGTVHCRSDSPFMALGKAIFEAGLNYLLKGTGSK